VSFGLAPEGIGHYIRKVQLRLPGKNLLDQELLGGVEFGYRF